MNTQNTFKDSLTILVSNQCHKYDWLTKIAIKHSFSNIFDKYEKALLLLGDVISSPDVEHLPENLKRKIYHFLTYEQYHE